MLWHNGTRFFQTLYIYKKIKNNVRRYYAQCHNYYIYTLLYFMCDIVSKNKNNRNILQIRGTGGVTRPSQKIIEDTNFVPKILTLAQKHT